MSTEQARRAANARYRARMQKEPRYLERQRERQAQRRMREKSGDTVLSEAIALWSRLPPPQF